MCNKEMLSETGDFMIQLTFFISFCTYLFFVYFVLFFFRRVVLPSIRPRLLLLLPLSLLILLPLSSAMAQFEIDLRGPIPPSTKPHPRPSITFSTTIPHPNIPSATLFRQSGSSTAGFIRGSPHPQPTRRWKIRHSSSMKRKRTTITTTTIKSTNT